MRLFAPLLIDCLFRIILISYIPYPDRVLIIQILIDC